MVKNILETGTPFDYKDVDFNKRDRLSADSGLLVGYDSNPDKNQIYIDKEKTFEEE